MLGSIMLEQLLIRKFIYLLPIIVLSIYPVVCDECTLTAICNCNGTNSIQFNTLSNHNEHFVETHSNNEFNICVPHFNVTPADAIKKYELNCTYVETNQPTFNHSTENDTFILILKYPCKVPEPEQHSYSTGSILVIIFFTCIFAYLGMGIAVNFFLIGARGIELLPHLSFWKDFPGLVGDGAKFLQSGCNAKPSELSTTSPDGYDAI